MFKAVDAGDKAGLASAYGDFLKAGDISLKDYDTKTKAYTQGYSTEYDWKFATPKGTIYVR